MPDLTTSTRFTWYTELSYSDIIIRTIASMFKFIKKLRIPFIPKKVSTVPTEEDIVAAQAEAKQYPLICTSEKLQALIDNKFVTDAGVQLKPAEFLRKITSYIEKSQPQSIMEFEKFVNEIFTTLPLPEPKKKRFSFRKNK